MISTYDSILNEFDALPRSTKQTTYLELCKYPYNRFEEICSRLLCFYLDPKKEHNLRDLLLRSLMNVIGFDRNLTINTSELNIISEDNAEGKRLDILIHSIDFVIGIENKITAQLYNPLETYKNRIELYSNQNVHCIVLSLRKIVNAEELRYMHSHNFKNITYNQLFAEVEKNLKSYSSFADMNYLAYLKDFMNTLYNLSGHTQGNKELEDYFFDNSTRIEQLKEQYNLYNERISKVQNDNIALLKEQIDALTQPTWWIWRKYLLGFREYNNNKNLLGIEASYEATKTDVLGEFHIHFVTWSLADWNAFEEILIANFPNGKVSKSTEKCSIAIDIVYNNDEGIVLDKLINYYHLLIKTVNS